MDFAAFPGYATISARKKVLHQAAYGIDVATCVRFLMRQEIRRGVLPSSAKAYLQNMSITVGDPEVDEFNIIVGLSDEDVFRLDVIMNDTLPMNCSNGFK
jgi:hypothetical protein